MDAFDLLRVWEAGAAADGAGRALLLQSLLHPDADAEQLRAVPLGVRDGELMALRARLFGDLLQLRAQCPSCAEELEFGVDVGRLLPGRPVPDPVGGGEGRTRDGRDGLTLTVGPWSVRARPPTAADLEDAARALREAGPDAARGRLLSACVLQVEQGGAPSGTEDLPEQVAERVVEALGRADPVADLGLELSCPGCGTSTTAVLDVPATVWTELETWVRDTLAQVHQLAGAYGWSEREVLGVSPARRQVYLELVKGG